eukprot:COSAG01_NODE_4789_length_4742_cov_2.795822_2_plen_122_part_00
MQFHPWTNKLIFPNYSCKYRILLVERRSYTIEPSFQDLQCLCVFLSLFPAFYSLLLTCSSAAEVAHNDGMCTHSDRQRWRVMSVCTLTQCLFLIRFNSPIRTPHVHRYLHNHAKTSEYIPT